LPKGDVEIREAKSVMDECLFVEGSFKPNVGHDEYCLDEEIACCEKAGPHMTVSRHQSALFVVEKSLAISTRPKNAIQRKTC
jgi:hypothetical protein